jgi:hypothetical protein
MRQRSVFHRMHRGFGAISWQSGNEMDCRSLLHPSAKAELSSLLPIARGANTGLHQRRRTAGQTAVASATSRSGRSCRRPKPGASSQICAGGWLGAGARGAGSVGVMRGTCACFRCEVDAGGVVKDPTANGVGDEDGPGILSALDDLRRDPGAHRRRASRLPNRRARAGRRERVRPAAWHSGAPPRERQGREQTRDTVIATERSSRRPCGRSRRQVSFCRCCVGNRASRGSRRRRP